mmetsp:Transcript_12681/g.14043  ORF Transcript_12681/g.14043 Transcript_12681/m.14043 type:complete len:106 (+) Transcript_12681:133-450(+)
MISVLLYIHSNSVLLSTRYFSRSILTLYQRRLSPSVTIVLSMDPGLRLVTFLEINGVYHHQHTIDMYSLCEYMRVKERIKEKKREVCVFVREKENMCGRRIGGCT